MAKELKDYTIDELMNEVRRRDGVLGAICWDKADVQEVLDDCDAETNADEFIRKFGGEWGYFNDRMNEEARDFVEALY